MPYSNTSSNVSSYNSCSNTSYSGANNTWNPSATTAYLISNAPHGQNQSNRIYQNNPTMMFNPQIYSPTFGGVKYCNGC